MQHSFMKLHYLASDANNWSTSFKGTNESFSDAGTSFSGQDPCLEIDDIDLIDIIDDFPIKGPGDFMKGEGGTIDLVT